ncbi:hypothetical protein Tco_0150806 [Tanacetum coccineum]
MSFEGESSHVATFSSLHDSLKAEDSGPRAYRLQIAEGIIPIFAKGVDADMGVLMAARASGVENQDAIDTAKVGMLADPKEVWKIVFGCTSTV